jgi:uncharacterized UBP type Zn finger protein
VERPVISLEECISAAFGDDSIEGYTSPVTNQRGIANQQNRMATFPDYLIIQLRVSYFLIKFGTKNKTIQNIPLIIFWISTDQKIIKFSNILMAHLSS